MPYSADENRQYVYEIVSTIIKPGHILDVGAGSGTYSDLLRGYHPAIEMVGVEVWAPYIEQFNLKSKYDWIDQHDIRDHVDFDYDLVIFGDVLEHMTLEESKAVWEKASKEAGWGMISVPVVHYPQGAEFGNPYEEHIQDHLTVQNIEDHFGPFDYSEKWDVTATFFRRFN